MSGFGPSGFGPSGGLPDAYENPLLGRIFEAGTLTGAWSADLGAYLRAGAVGTDAYAALLTGNLSVSEGAVVDEAIVFGMLALASASGTLGESLTGLQAYLETVGDAMVVAGLATSRQDATVAVIAAATMESMLASGWAAEAVGTAEFNQALVSELTLTIQMTQAAIATGAFANTLRMTTLLAEGATIAGAHTLKQIHQEHVEQGMTLYVSFRLGDEEYTGWVLNTKLGAVSEYRNFPFNSFPAWGGHSYGVREDGLYLLNDGDDDEGEPIEAWIRTALETFGTMRRKRTPSVYVTWTGDGDLLLKVVAIDRDTGELTEDWYTAEEPAGEMAHHNSRIKVGRGLEAVSFAYELRNIDGADFAHDELAWLPLILDGRI